MRDHSTETQGRRVVKRMKSSATYLNAERGEDVLTPVKDSHLECGGAAGE
jgi:hypothetical protein